MNLEGEQFKADKRKFIFAQQEVKARDLLLEEAKTVTAGSKRIRQLQWQQVQQQRLKAAGRGILHIPEATTAGAGEEQAGGLWSGQARAHPEEQVPLLLPEKEPWAGRAPLLRAGQLPGLEP